MKGGALYMKKSTKKILVTMAIVIAMMMATACPATETSMSVPDETTWTSETTEATTTARKVGVARPTTEATQTTATPTPKPTATPAPTATPTPVPVSETTEATTQTAAPTPKPTATPVPEPTDPPATPTPVPEPEPTEAPTEPEPTEPGRDLYAEIDNAVSYAESLGYTITDVRSGYGFTFVNATGTYKGVVTASGDWNDNWILSYTPVDEASSDYSYYDYTPDLISAIGNIDSDYLYF